MLENLTQSLGFFLHYYLKGCIISSKYLENKRAWHGEVP